VGRGHACQLLATKALASSGPETSRRASEPPAEEIDLGAPTHRPLQHLQPGDLAFHGAVTPGQPEAGFDRLIIGAEPRRKAPQGRYGTRRRTRQPAVEAVGLACTHEHRKVLREVNRGG
jgi:hypothetical protein